MTGKDAGPSEASRSVRAELERELSRIHDLDKRPSRHGDSNSYFLAGREIAHFHGATRMDVRLTRSEIRRLKSEGALNHQVTIHGPSAEWAAVQITRSEEIPYALSLVELAVRANS